MENIHTLRNWPLGAALANGARVVLDLQAWQRPNATCIIAITSTVAKLHAAGHTVEIRMPRDDYAKRLFSTVGFIEGLETFSSVTGSRLDGSVQRHFPIVNVSNFRTERDVDRLGENLEDHFMRSGKIAANLLEDVLTCLSEASVNVVNHAQSEVGGFAMAQMRHFKILDYQANYIEIAVGDPGRGIAASFGMTADADAIAHSMKEGTTSTGDPTRGVGLFEIELAAKRGAHRVVIVHSGNGVVMKGSGMSDRAETTQNRIMGTLLTVLIPC